MDVIIVYLDTALFPIRRLLEATPEKAITQFPFLSDRLVYLTGGSARLKLLLAISAKVLNVEPTGGGLQASNIQRRYDVASNLIDAANRLDAARVNLY